MMKGLIEGTRLSFLVDTGPKISVLNANFAAIQSFVSTSPGKIIKMLGGTSLNCKWIKFQGTHLIADFL